MTTALLVAAAVMVPSLTAHAQTPPDDTTTTVAPPPSDPTTTTTLAPPPPPPPPPPAEPPPTAPPETAPAPAPAPAPVDDRGALPLGGCAISTVIRLNSRSADVICVERILYGLGYQFAGPDELFGLDSWYSLKDFQRNNGLLADGILGPITGRKMGIWGTASPVAAAAPAPAVDASGEYRGPLPLGGCAISTVVRLNTRSNDVVCVERVLGGLGYQFAGPDEVFGLDSWYSLKDFQRNNGLLADGVLGPITGRKMGIWGTATPVAAAAPEPAPAPEPAGEYGLPGNSGSGRRIVYHRGQQRIWAVEADGSVVKTHLVSGRTYEPYAGTYSVYSRSMYTYSTADPAVKWRYMVRFAYGPGGGRIGFHEIPVKYGAPLQSERQLGQPLSGGCVRQSTADAQWMWNWAGTGTKVVVL